MRGLFVTGTDTAVGKTYVATGVIAALRSRGVRVGAYKPAVSGSISGPTGPVWDDLVRLHAALGGDFPIERICPQRFHAPLAPPVAALREGKRVDAALLRSGADWWRNHVDVLVVEGAGGLLAPLTDSESVADVAVAFGFPLLIVARLSLGTINHTLLTVEAARSRRLALAGVVLNQAVAISAEDVSSETNAAELERRCGVPILTILPHAPASDLLQHAPFSTIDWLKFTLPCDRVG